MPEPVDFCKKRMSHIKIRMANKNIDLVCIVKDRIRRQQYNLNKRLANTEFGSALLIPKDGAAILLCTQTGAIDARNESWVKVREMKSKENLDISIVDFASEHLKNEKSNLGMNLSVLNYKSYNYFKEKLKGKVVNIETTLLPEVFFGLYPKEDFELPLVLAFSSPPLG